MKRHFVSVGLGKLCGLFGKSRQAFYDHLWRRSDDKMQEAFIIDLVSSVRKTLPKVGTVKLLHMLKDDFSAHKISIGRDTFFKLLRKHDLLVKTKKRFVRTTMSSHHFKKWPDLTENIIVTTVEQLWVSDITYLTTQNGFIYLSLITDVYSRKIIGYHLSQHLKAQGCLIALNKAISSLSVNATVIHHSDRGIQYCCDAYIETLQNNNIAISMTQNGSPYDNAIAERINGILKAELNLGKIFVNYSAAIPVVHQAIDAYNRVRPHMSCGNLTPEKAHKQTGLLIKKWKSKNYCKAKSVLL
ncbi:MAG: IS3 family transposase [Bacteroidota bacterium]